MIPLFNFQRRFEVYTHEEIARRLIGIVQSIESKKILGTQLGLQLKEFGFSRESHGSLRDFINRYAPSVQVVGRSGADYYYALGSDIGDQDPSSNAGTTEHAFHKPQTESAVAPLALDFHSSSSSIKIDPAVWKTFVSPQGHYRLYGNRASRHVAVTGPEQAELQYPWEFIPPCSVEEHLRIAADFVSAISDLAQREKLTQALATGSGPNSGFYQAVLALGLGSAWTKFRHRRLLEQLEHVFVRRGMAFPPTLDRALLNEYRLSAPSTSSRPGRMPSPTSTKDVVIAAVQRMADSDLRELKLPIGIVLDLLSQR